MFGKNISLQRFLLVKTFGKTIANMPALCVPLRSIRDSLLYQMRAASHLDRRPYSVDSNSGHFGRSVNHSFENGSRENKWQPASLKTNTRTPFNFGGSENRSLENITRENITQPAPFQTNRHDSIPHGTESRSGGTSRSMDFIRGVMDEDRKGGGFMRRDSQFSNCTIQQDADFVHMKLLRKNTFVTVTDSNGNTKCSASSGCLTEMKGGPKVSRYAAEAIAEHVGRLAKQMGLKSLVVKVNGFTYFKKKKQAILSFREGFTNSRSDQNPIVYIEDTTRKPHNGCRLPKQRRH